MGGGLARPWLRMCGGGGGSRGWPTSSARSSHLHQTKAGLGRFGVAAPVGPESAGWPGCCRGAARRCCPRSLPESPEPRVPSRRPGCLPGTSRGSSLCQTGAPQRGLGREPGLEPWCCSCFAWGGETPRLLRACVSCLGPLGPTCLYGVPNLGSGSQPLPALSLAGLGACGVLAWHEVEAVLGTGSHGPAPSPASAGPTSGSV